MLLVEKYLETHTFSQLYEDHKVIASKVYNGKVSLNYEQFGADERDAVANECRGLIITFKDIENYTDISHVIPKNLRIIAFPMYRFFNYNCMHGLPTHFDATTLSAYEKIDGSLCIVYFDFTTNAWQVATRSVPTGENFVPGGKQTFAELFYSCAANTYQMRHDDFFSRLDKNYTYCFELTSPLNIVVIPHTQHAITLLAARNMLTLKEANIYEEESFAWFVKARRYDLTSIDNVLNYVQACNADKTNITNEGIVICDNMFNRIKVKNINYVLAHKATNLLSSPRTMLQLILENKEDDIYYITTSQAIKDRIDYLKCGLLELCQMTDDDYMVARSQAACAKPKHYRAEFAELAKNHRFSEALFAVFNGQANNTLDFITQPNKSKLTPARLNKLLSIIDEL